MSSRPIVLRAAVAAASLSVLLITAACGGTGTPSTGGSSSTADFSQKGPIEFWRGKDVTGVVTKLIDEFNATHHPDETVTLHELPDSADAQRQQIILNSQIKNDKMAVVRTDVVWTSEFAANGYLTPLPTDQFSTDGFLKPTVDAATYYGKLYGVPYTSNGGLLFYRKDLLDKYGLKPPTTWDEMKTACKKIQAGEKDAKLNCYSGQFDKYEGLTVNFAEAVTSAGGVITDPDGKPNVNTPEAKKGLQLLIDSFNDGTIPKAAVTWKEEEGRQAFQGGELIFLRTWATVYALSNKTDGSSKVAGKFDVAPLPGLTGPGVSSLGGQSLAIGTNAANKGTAAEFIKFMTSKEVQKKAVLGNAVPPTLESLYTDPDVVKAYPYTPALQTAIQTAVPRPRVVHYGDVTSAIQDAVYPAIQGQTSPDSTLSDLQSELETLTK
ncbi:MAG TPA: ABC transporter substrate-binding protein [Microlunatus sp.]|nr:ABC transporter substrate-binding protein [Microlunatus sp.]